MTDHEKLARLRVAVGDALEELEGIDRPAIDQARRLLEDGLRETQGAEPQS
ncbi:MAG TPA: hypothetical protein VK506_09970 [Conexibacter sp.]|nr:hypothetical protein [Conexibacter sp.]